MGPGPTPSRTLGPATYQVREVSQAGWVQTAPAGGTYEITMTSGLSATGRDFGNRRLNVAPVNTVPGAQTIDEDTVLVFSSGNGNPSASADVDAGSNPVEVTLTATHGVLTLGGTAGLTFTAGDGAADGTMTFTGNLAAINTALDGLQFAPAANFNGAAGLTLTTNDLGNTGAGGPLSDTDTVALTITPVNDAPVAVNDAYTTAEDTALTVAAASGVLGNDSDVDGDPLTAVLVTGPAHGTLSLNANGAFTYTPAANFNGADAFTYRANDGALDSNLATVALTITAVNDAPVAVNDAYTTAEDTALTVAAASGVLGNDSDLDGDPLSAVLVTGPAHGTLSLNADGAFTYTPAANFNGADAFTYRANDGALDSNLATVALTITPVNDAPVAVNDAYTTAEDTALTVAAASGVLGNDSDLDGDPLSAVLVTGPAHGTLSLNADGAFTYTPAANFNGADAFTYRANDGALNSNLATVALTITPVNDAPVAVNDAYTTAEDTALTVAAASGVLGNDSDLDGDPLTAVLVTGPAHGTLSLNADGAFTYTPAANFNGADAFTYRANDGAAELQYRHGGPHHHPGKRRPGEHRARGPDHQRGHRPGVLGQPNGSR